MAATLEDVVMRRTGMGQLGAQAPAEIAIAAGVMAEELGWKESRTLAEIASLAPIFRTTEDQP
jgi:glycerol-3-phosphate dehydrogenase